MAVDLGPRQVSAFDALPMLLDVAGKGVVPLAAAGTLVPAIRKTSAAARQTVWLPAGLDGRRNHRTLVRRAAIIALAAMAALAMPMACSKAPKKAQFKDATITLYMDLQSGKHVPDSKLATVLHVTDPKRLEALLAFFPEMDRGKEAWRAAGWMAGVEIKFGKRDGKIIRVSVSSNDDLTVWSEGKGDWPVNGDLKAFLLAFQKAQAATQPATVGASTQSAPSASSGPAPEGARMPTAPRPATQPAEEQVQTDWSAAREGVQMRLRAARKTWRADEIPALRWDVRNIGTRKFLAVGDGQRLAQLEVDGVWHQWPIGLRSAREADLGAGAWLEDQVVTVSPIWSWAMPEDLEWRRDGGGGRIVLSGAESPPSLQLKPGKHTIRLAVIVTPSRVDTGDGFRVVSEPMDITIEALPAGQTASWPPGPKLAQAVKEALHRAQIPLENSPRPWEPGMKNWIAEALAKAKQAARLTEGTPLHASASRLAEAFAALQQATDKDPAGAAKEFSVAGTAYRDLVSVLAGVDRPVPSGAATQPATKPAAPASGRALGPTGFGKLVLDKDLLLWVDEPGAVEKHLLGAPASSWTSIRFERRQGHLLATLKSKEAGWSITRHVKVQVHTPKQPFPAASDTQVLSTVEAAIVRSGNPIIDVTLHFDLGEADKIPEPAFYSVSASAVEDGSAAKATPQPSTTSSPAGSGSTFSAANGASTQPAEMVITPGVGVGPITPGMSKEDVIRHLGKPVKIEGEGGYGLNYISSLGLSVLVSPRKGVVSISCWTSRVMYWLYALGMKDFRGATEKGIKMGAGRDDIVRAYGKADSESGDASLLYMDYRSQGIQFMLRYGKLAKIDVLEPDVFALIPAAAFSQPAATTHPSTQPATQPGG